MCMLTNGTWQYLNVLNDLTIPHIVTVLNGSTLMSSQGCVARFCWNKNKLYTSDFHSDDFIRNCIDVDSAQRDRHLWVIQPQEGVILPEGFTFKPRCPGVLLVSAASPYQQLFSWAARGILLDTMGFRKISLPMRKTKPQIVR